MKEKSSLHTLPSPPYDVCYRIPKSDKWWTHKNLNREDMLLLCDYLVQLGRPFRIRGFDGKVVKVGSPPLPLLLNLFSNTLSDRRGLPTV